MTGYWNWPLFLHFGLPPTGTFGSSAGAKTRDEKRGPYRAAERKTAAGDEGGAVRCAAALRPIAPARRCHRCAGSSTCIDDSAGNCRFPRRIATMQPISRVSSLRAALGGGRDENLVDVGTSRGRYFCLCRGRGAVHADSKRDDTSGGLPTGRNCRIVCALEASDHDREVVHGRGAGSRRRFSIRVQDRRGRNRDRYHDLLNHGSRSFLQGLVRGVSGDMT